MQKKPSNSRTATLRTLTEFEIFIAPFAISDSLSRKPGTVTLWRVLGSPDKSVDSDAIPADFEPTPLEDTMTVAEIMKELKSQGNESYRKILRNHGINESLGVKIEYLKKIQKRIKKDYRLALQLYDTGIYDARYLAGLIADETKMTKKDLQHWLATAECDALCGFTVSWVAAESKHGRELALEWIDSKKESVACAGWSTLSSLVAITDDASLDMAELKKLLARVQKTIHKQPDRVRYAMNGFVIAVGTYVADLTEAALKAGTSIGAVRVDMGNTSCEVPFAPEYIKKAQKRGRIGKKRESAKC
jgi:3-methyladenine DNA glycosylase AlkD